MLSQTDRTIRNRGFTLVELMIAVVVMVLMMLAFGMIVSEAQKVVTISENKIRGNMTADAIERVIRNDISKINKSGFLCICKNPSHINTPVLIGLGFGKVTSKTCELFSDDGYVTSYGYAINEAASNGYGDKLATNVLFLRQALVLSTAGDGSADERDIWDHNITIFTGGTRTQINTYINDLSDYLGNSVVSVPPTEFSHIEDMWQVMSKDIECLGIMWTEGTKDASGNLKWYGVDYDNGYKVKARCEDTSLPVAEQYDYDDKDISDDVLEYTQSPGYGYRALWTHNDTTNWPKAIKIRFRLRDPELGEEHSTSDTQDTYTDYEVICNVP
ncbi:MAG: prepilin-type N-terminal cleavage/methylation domain-containing protein [Phycisphaerae bacterium]|nr:prepilin-type N-terminal cleavage/methylation domain-containing protein [Phycisphaerae bacterium]